MKNVGSEYRQQYRKRHDQHADLAEVDKDSANSRGTKHIAEAFLQFHDGVAVIG